MNKICFAAAAMAGLSAAAGSDWHQLPWIDPAKFQQKWFDNQHDHFDFQNETTYRQRYWVNDEYWTNQDDPVFIYICGEYTCSVPDTRLYPFMIGASYGARLMVLEHRYYGESQLFDNWETENLRLLSSEQALADLAYFLATMNKDLPSRPTVVIGGSYPGALSAWFKSRYPHLAVASWASSGVVEPIVNLWKFDEQVYTSSAKSGDACPAAIEAQNDWIDQQGIIRQSGAGYSEIDRFLDTTGSAGMRTDDFMFYYADIWVESVQYGHRTALCDLLADNAHQDPAAIFHLVTQFGSDVPNVNPEDYDTRLLGDTTIDFGSSGRCWTYQYCTEYGFWQVPSEIHPMRSELLRTQFWPDMCERTFKGLNMNNRPKAWETKADQGGWNIAGTNTFFTNGDEDPWKWATKTESVPEWNQVAVTADCDNCGHCAELYTPTDDDPVELAAVRQQVADWLDDILQPLVNKTKPFLQ